MPDLVLIQESLPESNPLRVLVYPEGDGGVRIPLDFPPAAHAPKITLEPIRSGCRVRLRAGGKYWTLSHKQQDRPMEGMRVCQDELWVWERGV